MLNPEELKLVLFSAQIKLKQYHKLSSQIDPS